MAVEQAAQAGRAVDSAHPPAGRIGFESAADQVLAGTLDLAAAWLLPLLCPLARRCA